MGDYFCNRQAYLFDKALNLMFTDLPPLEQFQKQEQHRELHGPKDAAYLKLYHAQQIYEELGKRGFQGYLVSSIDGNDPTKEQHPDYTMMITLLNDIKDTHKNVQKTILAESSFMGTDPNYLAVREFDTWIGEVDKLIGFVKDHGAIYGSC